ncbi:MAG: purine-nucleoside phosphorylase, partial [Oscillospiraceae bacterium]|nr:purine-nucleoside phosphorylase [Oscillospiraceae bacterium]
GSGLGGYADGIKQVASVDYSEIKDFPISTVMGHRGRFVFGYVEDVPVVVMQGRVHYYEGYKMEDVVLPTRLMKLMGAKVLFLTNAAGGINFSFEAGDLMLINDHICMAPSPLIGENLDELGPRFPDMSEVYNKKLRNIVKHTARKLDIPLREGVYIQLTGPSYETPAEIRMARTMGADAVGMSTGCEAIAANHAGMKVVGISCISNLAAGVSNKPLSHAEVQETADRTAPLFRNLVTGSIVNIHRELENI